MPYSRKDFTGRNLQDRKDMNGLTITGSCFSQETPDTHVFPEDMTGVTFNHCNLMNCYIPDGNTVINCQTTRYAVQNDLNDWEIDENGIPLTPVNYLYFFKKGIPHPNPADIPDERVEKRIKIENPYRNVEA